jgi:hypothetical protein
MVLMCRGHIEQISQSSLRFRISESLGVMRPWNFRGYMVQTTDESQMDFCDTQINNQVDSVHLRNNQWRLIFSAASYTS